MALYSFCETLSHDDSIYSSKNFGEFARNMTDYLNKETSNMLPKEKRTKGMNRYFSIRKKKTMTNKHEKVFNFPSAQIHCS